MDETYTKLHNKVKYDNVKANIPPLEDYNFQADLLMLPETSKGFKYLLVVVDLWSDEFDCEPLKTKEPTNVLKGLQRIFKGKYLKKPYATLGTDGGTEFKGVFHSYLYENSIFHKVGMPYRHKQQGNAENLNRLLGRFLNNYMNKMEEETKKTYTEWTDILPQLITELNLIRKRPDENPFTYNYAQPNFDKKPKYKIGDLVYYKLDAPLNHLGHREGGKFRQGDLRYNKFEPRKIIRVLFYPKNIRYMLENMHRVSYTEDELLPANNETGSKYKVRKIIGRKTEQGIIKYLVWWSGYLKKDATWEPKTELIKDGVEVITPNPKTSGGARWNYLAAYAYGLKQELGSLDKIDFNSQKYKVADEKAKEYVSKLLKHVPVLDSGARGATNTFVQRQIGDVLLAWENEAFLAINELGKDEFEIVVPSVSILAEPPVTVVNKNAEHKGTLNVSNEYLKYLYSKDGQELAAKHYYRPSIPSLVTKEKLEIFPKLELFKIDDVFGSWENAQKTHFNDGGTFDLIYK